MSTENSEVNALARSFMKLEFISKLIEARMEEINGQLKWALKDKVYNGIALTPGKDSCRPSWQGEWKALCIALGKDPEVEMEKIKEKTGKNCKGDAKIAIDAFFSPDNETKETLIEYIDNL